MKKHIINNLHTIQKRIQTACHKSNRNPEEVRLLLATKTVSPDRIQIAIDEGFSLIGENKVQELKQKASTISVAKPEIHFIGHLQTNKIKEVLKWAHCIESVDRISLAQKLHNRLALDNKTLDIFVQVNTSGEKSKFGVSPENAIPLLKEISQFETLNIKGLMTIGLLSTKSEEVRKCFKTLKTIQEQVNASAIPNIKIEELSMGMSGDLEIAIEEGATIIRVGTAIFGEREYPDTYYWNEQKTII
ncbi:YggS family pyridoxal phosphate-dependent enzyme [Aquimarina hainanensis]|uniref:Pyridoxal phosphate homeostasis protein n=1 Tax=Aquimarina hainanensis TaxID=1578017 RepID=A0ABW5N8X7_9FLAO|nr:YggS family pyridoxal phosphate-dependent enzyme [Aquimarina sp. TRL1]QKX03678.1 YggS family pyridoxal phosphate-dependent enzyme [Aquimarina sp. TRL1]